jgi:hypothetical protein
MLTEKPAGVDLLAIVLLINGIFSFFSGLDSLYFASFLSSVVPINTAVPGIVEATAQYVAIWGLPIMNIIVGYWTSVFTILLSVLIIYYLTRREVLVYFGRKISAPSDVNAT